MNVSGIILTSLNQVVMLISLSMCLFKKIKTRYVHLKQDRFILARAERKQIVSEKVDCSQ